MEFQDSRVPKNACKYFHSVVGCRFGNQCRFSHSSVGENTASVGNGGPSVSLTASSAPLPPFHSKIRCQWFLQGNCRYGSACRYSHVAAPAPAVEAPDSGNEVTCNICLEPINLFAILSGCDHSFCMPCIHKWRSEASSQISEAGVKSNRSCPMCRAPSEFILPSAVYVEKEAKQELIKSMLAVKAKTPCKDWVSKKKCKFGGKCFYAHLDDNGKDLKPQQLESFKNRRQHTRGFYSRYGNRLFSSRLNYLHQLFEMYGGNGGGMGGWDSDDSGWVTVSDDEDDLFDEDDDDDEEEGDDDDCVYDSEYYNDLMMNNINY